MSEGTVDQVLGGTATWCVLHGDCLELLKNVPDNTFDSAVCDPPYGLGFMGRAWDAYAKSQIDPGFLHWLAGFADGEGCFSVHKKVVNGCETFDCQFSISLRADDRPILERIHRTLGIGTLSKPGAHRKDKENPSARWSVSSKNDQVFLREVFRAFPLRAKKAVDFEIWSDALEAWLHHEQGEWEEMASLRAELMASREYAPGGVRVDPFQMWCWRWAREVLRVLKPGAHLVAFGGTRTNHRLACAVEDAGFEIRDQITWQFGSGFPKSLNISKAIDAHLGAERETVGVRAKNYPDTPSGYGSVSGKGGTREGGLFGEVHGDVQAGRTVTAAATPEAAMWEGWGTSLKPAHEPIILARKPIEKGLTVAENVLKWGTGSLNVDGCRVGTSKDTPHSTPTHGGQFANGGWNGYPTDASGMDADTGRWPPNVVFTHDARCRRLGATEVPANPTWDTPSRETKSTFLEGSDGVSPVRHANGRDGEASAANRYADQGSTSFAPLPGARRDDTETVERWECVEGCPVRELAMQSGACPVSGNATMRDFTNQANEVFSKGLGGKVNEANQYADSGSAARYFPQFEYSELDDITPFLYAAKAGRAERDAGLDQFRPRSGAELTDSEDGQARLASPRTGAGRTGGARNPHPTIKPWKELLSWLCRLVTPPRGVVLDPFAGAASCGIACIAEGFRYAGIELNDSDEEPYVSIARARLHHVEGREFVPRPSLRAASPPRQVSLFSAGSPMKQADQDQAEAAEG